MKWNWGQAVLQNATTIGTEQLIVKIPSESQSAIQIQIKQSAEGQSPIVSSISIDQHGLQKLVHWLREEGAVQ